MAGDGPQHHPGNVEGIRRKADAVVWCSLDGTVVTVHGWSTPDDILAAPLAATGPRHHPVEAHQVPVEELRPLDGLHRLAPR